ncbi:MAG: septum formation initiator family protein [Puniceicoccales bacterium]|jgi:cell division protein FtsB|nr:septum formation initiator family protein [Puniceicoccales bacterium]
MGCDIFRLTKERCYKALLCLTSLLFLIVSLVGGIAVYRSYRQCKVVEMKEQQQWERYQQMKNKFEIQQEHVKELMENPDFIEHVARERIQIAGEDEVLFRFE